MTLIWEKHYPNGKLPSQTRKGSLWWKDILKLLDCFKSFSKVQVQNGKSCLFWSDNWSQQPLQLQYPELFSFAKNKVAPVAEFFSAQVPEDLFLLPLSTEAYQQLQTLNSIREQLTLTEFDDTWTPSWGKRQLQEHTDIS